MKSDIFFFERFISDGTFHPAGIKNLGPGQIFFFCMPVTLY